MGVFTEAVKWCMADLCIYIQHQTRKQLAAAPTPGHIRVWCNIQYLWTSLYWSARSLYAASHETFNHKQTLQWKQACPVPAWWHHIHINACSSTCWQMLYVPFIQCFCLVLMMPADRCGHTIVLIYFYYRMYFNTNRDIYFSVHVILLLSLSIVKTVLVCRYKWTNQWDHTVGLLPESHLTYPLYLICVCFKLVFVHEGEGFCSITVFVNVPSDVCTDSAKGETLQLNRGKKYCRVINLKRLL